MLEIREIEAEEFNFLWKMLYEAIYSRDQKLPASIVYEPSLAKYVAGFGQEGDYGFVLSAAGSLVGAAWTRLLMGKNKGYGFVDDSTPELSMAIVAAFRGQGHGQNLVEKLIGKLIEQGYRQLSLSVAKQNPALHLYQRLGFRILSETAVAYTMAKKLK